MTAIALNGANKGRLRPSFFFCGAAALLGLGAAWAQQDVYRCGREYTNAPIDAQRCERLALPAVTVIPGTRVAGAANPLAPSGASAAMPSARAPGAPQGPRDEMARTIVVAELAQARQRHAQLQQQWRELAPAGAAPSPQAEQLQAALARAERDIDSLQRELARRSPSASSP